MRMILLAAVLAAPVAVADTEIFHGWARDGSWLVYEVRGANELIELYFCTTDQTVTPTWPAVLNEMDRTDEKGLSCVHFLDPNKAPYEWKKNLQLPEPTMQSGIVKVLPELVTDGETPGFTLQSGDKKQTCYASGVREDSKLQKVWFHASGRFAAALIDGQVHHCALTVKGAGGKPRKK